jgi:nicotinamidase-related amidase
VSAGILDRERAALVVVDMQEAFRPAVLGFDEVVASVRTLALGAGALGVPIVVTEQYPKGLGHTVTELAELDEIAGIEALEKVAFSAARAEGFDLGGRTQALICGIETHVCVSQTAHDLIAQGIEVHVAQDAVSSRTAENRDLGLRKMERAGAVLTSTETALFEMLGAAGGPEFKTIQGLVK